jgi:hypothetical protein
MTTDLTTKPSLPLRQFHVWVNVSKAGRRITERTPLGGRVHDLGVVPAKAPWARLCIVTAHSVGEALGYVRQDYPSLGPTDFELREVPC